MSLSGASIIDPWSLPPPTAERTQADDYVTCNQPVAREQPLNDSQIAARLVMGNKGLPEFSGKPSEWPVFISAYTRSTEKCSFNDDENLDRLLKSLKGEARCLVKARLTSPTVVPSVIQTLYRNFGRPDVVLDELIENVRNQPTVRPDRLDHLLKLSATVENLCATLESSMLQDHLNNQILLKEVLVGK